jgi:RNA-binding protein YhbY
VKVIDELCKGVSPNAGINGIGSGKKVRNLLKCLAKALWEKDRAFLKDAESIAFTRDESHGRLIVRFTAGKADLTTRSGLFGQSRMSGSSGQNIADATAAMLRAMASPVKKGVLKGVVADVDQALYDSLRCKVEMLSVDSASNETLAANIMRRPEQIRADQELLTPNLKVLVRDKAHGMRRRPLQL